MISQSIIFLHYYREKVEVFARAHPFIALTCVINGLMIWPLLLVAALKLTALFVCILLSVSVIILAFSPLLLISLYSFITVISICTLFSWILIIGMKYYSNSDVNGGSNVLASEIEATEEHNGAVPEQKPPLSNIALGELGMIDRAKIMNDLLQSCPHEDQNPVSASAMPE